MEANVEKIEKGSTSNFFAEIIIVILFFAIASIIIVRIFATSVNNNDINGIRSEAIINAGSIIDVYKSGYSLSESLEKVIGGKFNNKNNKYTIILDDDMAQSDKGKVALIVEENVKTNTSGLLQGIRLRYVYKTREIYVIEGKKYEEK